MQNAVTGYNKFEKIEALVEKYDLKWKRLHILDLGGILHSFEILKEIFPKSEIYTFNMLQEDLKGVKNPIVGDAHNLSKSLGKRKFDVIFATDIIEHLVSPDDMLDGCHKYLKGGGYLFVTTPNLACWYNRIFLLMGLSPANYHPSLRYRVGNPFIGKFEGEHKSVFTFRGLKELIELHNFKIIHISGFVYKEISRAAGRYGFVRRLIDRILPNGLREGILVVARKSH